jgi:hypothetical protein
MEKPRTKLKSSELTEYEIGKWLEEERDAAADLSLHLNEFAAVEEREAAEVDLSGRAKAFGSMPAERNNGCWRGMFVQLNNTSTSNVANIKSAKLCSAIRKYDPHIVGLNEIGRNWDQYCSSERLSAFIGDLQRESRSMVTYNEHEKGINRRKYQPGGTGMLVLDELIPYTKRGSSDPRKLGRFLSYVMEGRNGHRTRVVTVYAVGRNKSERLASYYQQQLRYIQIHNLRTTPRKLLKDDLLQQLRVWRANGERIILMMDANENVTTGQLCRQLGSDDIELQNSTLLRHGSLPAHTHADGSEPIVGLWHTPDVEITEIKWLSFDESPGDHRACVFEFTTHSVIGNFEQRIVYPPCRRLNTKIKGVVERYGRLAEEQFAVHRILERLDRLEQLMGHTYPPSAAHQKAMDRLDQQVVEIQRYCEKNCRKIYRADLAFSAPVKLWHERVQVYTKLLRMHDGKIRNVGNLCRLARKRGIKRPKQLTVEEIHKRRAYARARKRSLRRMAPALQREHLRNLLLEAEANGYADKAADIRAIMDREGMKRMWWSIRHSMNDKSGKSVT